jgi:hypothetical protein
MSNVLLSVAARRPFGGSAGPRPCDGSCGVGRRQGAAHGLLHRTEVDREPANWVHVSGCRAGSDCVFYQDGKGRFDFRPITKPGH